MKESSLYNSALNAALKDLELNKSDIRCPEAELKDGLCCLSFNTDFQRYECMVDSQSLNVLGINTVPDNSGVFENYNYTGF